MKKLFYAVSLIAATTLATSCGSAPSTTTPVEMNVEEAIIENIMTRSSVRSYTSQAVEPEKIEILLKAGMAAPTGMNKQPWEFVVITDTAVLQKLPSVAGGMRMAAKAPLAIAVLGNPETSGSWMLDCSAATENILLAAHAIGLGGVWCGAYSQTDPARMDGLREVLSIPEGIDPLNVLIIGYPDKEPEVKDKWKPEKIHYNTYTNN